MEGTLGKKDGLCTSMSHDSASNNNFILVVWGDMCMYPFFAPSILFLSSCNHRQPQNSTYKLFIFIYKKKAISRHPLCSLVILIKTFHQ